MIVITNLS